MVKPATVNPDLTIVIVNWNTAALTCACLQSLADTGYASHNRCETVVVDNASTDDSVARIAAEFPWASVFDNRENVGFARANNQAIQQSLGQYVLLLNSDTQVQPGAIDHLVECLQSDPAAAACGPMLLNEDGSFQASYANFPTLLSELVFQFGLAGRVYSPFYPSYGPDADRDELDVDWVGGASLLVRRAALQQVGLLDEDYVMYAEEMDLCYRLHRAGWRIRYCPHARVIHLGGRSSASVPVWKHVQLHRGRVRFFAKHYGVTRARLLVAIIRSSSLLKAGAALLLPHGRRVAASKAYWTAVWAPLW